MRSKAPLGLLRRILGRTPDLIPTIVRGLYRKHLVADFDYRREDGMASGPPLMITLRVTNACNHRCAICGQHGFGGYSALGTHREQPLPVNAFMKLIDANKVLSEPPTTACANSLGGAGRCRRQKARLGARLNPCIHIIRIDESQRQ